MAKSRKDKRGYALRTGESQRQNGTYSYSYTDSERHRHTVYAKTLAEIRKKERQIIRDMEDDLDFENRIISVNHNLTNRPNEKGVCVKHISTTKTRSGVRTIPMIDEVYDAFLKEYELQKCMGYESETIDEFTNFVFLTHGGNVVAQGSVNWAIASIIEAYNKQETKTAKEEKREL